MRDVARRAESLLKEAVEGQGVELVHVEYEPKGAASVLRIYIDKPGGVNLKDCERISKHASVLLDVEDLVPHHYVLEVSSPGIERPLFKESDYLRFRGREIRLEAVEKIENRRKFTGFIRDFSHRILQLECDGRIYAIGFDKIKRAHLVWRS